MAAEHLPPDDDGERGSAVVDFVLVSLLIVALLLAVLQVAVYAHVRNVVTASAQEGARYAANADVDSALGAARTVEVVARATNERTAEGLLARHGRAALAVMSVHAIDRRVGRVREVLAAARRLVDAADPLGREARE